MSDNFDVTPGSGRSVATDDIGGVHHQRIKLSLGADGSATDALGGAGAVAAGVQRMTLASDDPAVTYLAILASVDPRLEYETVAASQTDQVLGPTGASGDVLESLLIVPASTSPGAVSIKDGGGSAITVFAGGTDSVSNLVPFPVSLGIKSTSGAWKVTTGTNVSVVASGQFT